MILRSYDDFVFQWNLRHFAPQTSTSAQGIDKWASSSVPQGRVSVWIHRVFLRSWWKRLIFTSYPEFARWSRESGSVTKKAWNYFLKQDIIGLLELENLDQFARCTDFHWKERSGTIWRDSYQKLMPNIAVNAKEKGNNSRIFKIKEYSFLSNTSSGYTAQEDEKEILPGRLIDDKSQTKLSIYVKLRIRLSLTRWLKVPKKYDTTIEYVQKLINLQQIQSNPSRWRKSSASMSRISDD